MVVYDEKEGRYKLRWPGKYSVGMLKAFFGNVIPLVWGFVYILAMGPQGLKEVTEQAVINTNYFMKLMEGVRGYDVIYGKGRFRKHETVISAKPMHDEVGVSAEDVAKGLLDAGFYAPTIYFPLIVPEALMIEFSDTETKENIERYAQRLKEISDIAYKNPEEPKKWPKNTAVRRVDTVKASHPRHVTPTWRVYRLRKEGKITVLK